MLVLVARVRVLVLFVLLLGEVLQDLIHPFSISVLMAETVGVQLSQALIEDDLILPAVRAPEATQFALQAVKIV